MKKILVEQDVNQTDRMCRTQCTGDFKAVLDKLRKGTPQQAEQVLRAARQEHHHMEQLLWIPNNPSAKQPVQAGSIPQAMQTQVNKYMQEAKRTVAQRKVYQSPRIRQNDSMYFVLGVPSSNGSSLIGLIHQDILEQVHHEQRKNLRVVPYPSDKRYKIESVDSDTRRDVKVNHAEENEGTSHYHINQVVVKFKTDPADHELRSIQNDIQSSRMKKLGYTYVFESKVMTAEQMIKYFKKRNIQYAEPHYLYMTNENMEQVQSFNQDAEPNDYLYSKYQWNLPIIQTEKGWSITKGNSDVIVAVIDTGVDMDHPDLKQNLVAGINVIDTKKRPMDDVGHGTHVAGVISALINNYEGVAGMTWNSKVMPVKVLDSTGSGSTYAVAQGIIWAADHGAKVINMSLGNYAEAEFMHDAIKYAFDRDVVLIAASGNDNTENPGYPAAYPEVFAVSATDIERNRAPFSNFGNYIDVMAPGVNIASTYPHNQYAALSGTSMASPHASALAALIRSANPLLKNTEVMDIMRRSAKDLGTKGKDKYFGYGQIDVVQALSEAQNINSSLTFWNNYLQRQLQQIQDKFAK